MSLLLDSVDKFCSLNKFSAIPVNVCLFYDIINQLQFIDMYAVLTIERIVTLSVYYATVLAIHVKTQISISAPLQFIGLSNFQVKG